PTLSHHLKKLVEAGLVDKEMRGRWAHFTVRPEGLHAFRAFLADLP
ncbi:MAG: helix-turn-helix domain-containing protein, partial [Cutibacterium avidum]|nr:helix-turn-helix domain-containing protein [Cutibacterium avidum]